MERFSGHHRAFRDGWIIAFLVGSLFGILRTVPNRFLSGIGTCYVELFRNVPLIVQFFYTGIWWYRNCCRKTSACGLSQSWIPNIQFFVSSMVCWVVYRRPRLRAGTRCHPVAAAWAEKRRSGNGANAAADLPLRSAAKRLSRDRAANDLRDDELRSKTPLSPPLSVWWIWRRRRGNCWITPRTRGNPLPQLP